MKPDLYGLQIIRETPRILTIGERSLFLYRFFVQPKAERVIHIYMDNTHMRQGVMIKI